MPRGSDFDRLVSEAVEASFAGWDFGWLDGRMVEVPPPWDYAATARRFLDDADRVLDLDTGGGEFLAGLAPFGGLVVATEGHAPNVPVAADTLRPFQVPAVAIRSAPDNVDQHGLSPDADGSALPFRDASFDLVLDRHSSYWPQEVRRSSCNPTAGS